MAVDIQKLFNEELPAALAKNADAAKQIGAKYQMNITGDGGGEWTIDVTDSGPKAEKGSVSSADCTITIASEDFQKLYADPNAGMQLFFAGKLKVTGNQMLAMKLPKLLQLASPS